MKPERQTLKLATRAALSALWLFLFQTPAFAQSSFYEGKTITIVQGREPGDAGDMRVKAILPFIQKHLPGNPTILSEYMPGGGGRKAANFVYRSVKPDGLTLGNLGAGFISNALLGETGVQYDIDRFVYLGSPYSSAHYLFLTKRDLQLGSLEKLRAAPGIRIGAQSVGHTIYIVGRLFSWLLDLKEPKFITAYAGSEIDVALMRGELDARAQAADWLLHRNRDWLDKRIMDFHAVFETPKGDKHPRFSSVPELKISPNQKRNVRCWRCSAASDWPARLSFSRPECRKSGSRCSRPRCARP